MRQFTPSENLRVELARQRKSQAKLAKETGIPESYVSSFMSGRMNLRLTEKAAIAETLNVKIDELFE